MKVMGRVPALLALALLLGCAGHKHEPRAKVQDDGTCRVFGFKPETEAFDQCVDEVDKAKWRQARSRARVNCTPMGNRTVCQ